MSRESVKNDFSQIIDRAAETVSDEQFREAEKRAKELARRPVGLRLTSDPSCNKCDGRGVIVKTTYYPTCLEVNVGLCSCIKAEFLGKVRLPKVAIGTTEEREVITR